MNIISQNVISLLFMCGVFGADADGVKSVMEGDSVTLNTDLTEIHTYRHILWMFDSELIAQITEGNLSYKDGRFKDRLQLDSKTAFLNITNMRRKHSGLYKLEAVSEGESGTTYEEVRVNVYESPHGFVSGKVEIKSVSVTEGHTVILQTDVTETLGDELIVWRFGDEGKLIAKHDIEAKSSTLYDTDVRFRDRLKLDEKTGSMTITNTRTTDSGLYTVKISSNKQTLYTRFTVTISAVPESGLSSGAVAGIFIGVLLISAAAAAAGVIYYRRKISELERQYEVKKVSVMEDYDVTLNTDVTEIQTADLIEWRSGDGGHLIAAIRGGIIEIYDTGLNERFTDRLELDKTTGYLTIMNSRNTDSGLYQLTIRQDSKVKYKMFNVSVCENTVSVFEGERVTLKTDTELQRDYLIEWMFGVKKHPIAEIRRGIISKFDDVADGIFRDCLELDEKTGSLTITNSVVKHAGVYQLLITSISGPLSNKTFTVDLRTRNISVTDGKNMILNPETEIQKDDQIQWRFGDKEILIAEIRGGTGVTHDDVADGRFRRRLKLDEKIGSLIIRDITAEQSGVYKLQISNSRGNTDTRFVVAVNQRIVTVDEGESVTLESNTEIQKGELIQWMFGAQDIVIAASREGTGKTHVLDGRFRGRLELDEKTGSLTITRMRNEHTGVYKLQTSGNRVNAIKTFKIIVECSAYTYKTVLDGENVTLSSDTFIVKDEVNWFFNDEILATGNNRAINKTSYCDEIFKDRLELDHQTGSLTIKNTRTSDSGVYRLKFPKLGIVRRFRVTVNERNITVTEGKNVILHSETEIQKDDLIQWMIENILIAELKEGTRGKTHDDVADGRFRGRLKLDEKTGSLTIANIKQSGEYKLQISSSRGNTNNTFFVTVFKAEFSPFLKRSLQPGNQKNDSAAVQMPPVDEEDPHGGNKQERTSLL